MIPFATTVHRVVVVFIAEISPDTLPVTSKCGSLISIHALVKQESSILNLNCVSELVLGIVPSSIDCHEPELSRYSISMLPFWSVSKST